MRSYGARAARWPQAAQEAPYVASDPSGFGSAFVAVVDGRREGLWAAFVPLFEAPRTGFLRSIYGDLTRGTSYDAFQERMFALAAGLLSVNGRPQEEVERSTFTPAIRTAFEHITLTADLTIFRSLHELELAASALGSRPQRYEIYAPIDESVPTPPTTPAVSTDTIAIWTDPGDEIAADLAQRILMDLPMRSILVDRNRDATQTLAAARLILCMSEDPGSAIALAHFGRQLAAASPGTREHVRDVATFEFWDLAGGIDAVQRALGLPPPQVLPHTGRTAPHSPPTPTFEQPPLVSIVMVVYDRLAHLDANLERLQRQTYPNIEIVVVSNNGPRADSICAKYPNVVYIHRAENSGAAGEPRNDGIAIARGEFITALDDDDFFFDDHVATMVGICARGADVVYGDFLIQIIDPQDDGEYLLGYDIEVGKAITAHELLVQNRLGYMTMFARRSVYEALGVAYDQIDVYGASEVELWLRMAKSHAMAKSPKPTTLYTIRHNWKGSLTATDHFKFATGYERMYAKYPVPELPLIQARRINHVAALRSAEQSPPRHARYTVEPRKIP